MVQTNLFRKRNEIILDFFLSFFLIASVEYIDIVLSEIKDISESILSASFSLTLKETTLCEQGVV